MLREFLTLGSVELGRGGLSTPAVDEAKRHARGLTIYNGLVDGHTSLFVRVRDNECKVNDVVLLSS